MRGSKLFFVGSLFDLGRWAGASGKHPLTQNEQKLVLLMMHLLNKLYTLGKRIFDFCTGTGFYR